MQLILLGRGSADKSSSSYLSQAFDGSHHRIEESALGEGEEVLGVVEEQRILDGEGGSCSQISNPQQQETG